MYISNREWKTTFTDIVLPNLIHHDVLPLRPSLPTTIFVGNPESDHLSCVEVIMLLCTANIFIHNITISYSTILPFR